MWILDKPEFKPVTLDFTSSGQGKYKTRELWASGAISIY